MGFLSDRGEGEKLRKRKVERPSIFHEGRKKKRCGKQEINI